MPENYSANPELVRDLMTVGVATCSPDTPIDDIARLLLDKGLEAVVVLDPVDGHVNDELHDLGISATRQSPLEALIQRREAARSRNDAGRNNAGRNQATE
ncbi:MAG: hypothetical protein A2W35_02790 [Chloroflexi bacterium RBG_16_57_11]|nr:MAG: hypothetical protein A2W35_02790 [Chloroflexi bacterium RBG_16_57_11]